MDTLSATLVLFLVMDPLGNVPLFLSLMKDLPPQRRRWVLARELVIALGALFLFLLAGKPMLDLLKLDLEAVSITGGIVLFLIGLRMIFPPKDGVFGEQIGGEPFIVPLAVPGIAMAWAGTAVVLFAATALYRWLGASVLSAFEKLMGMVLIAMSVQMLLDGLAGFLARVA